MTQHFNRDVEWLRMIKQTIVFIKVILLLVFGLIAYILYLAFY
jgi:hypothetical protein